MSTNIERRPRRRRRLVAVLSVLLGAVIAAAGSFFVTTTSAHAVETGVWYNVESRHSGLVMGIRAASTASGAELVQWAGNGSADQQFRFVDAGGGYYKIENRNSGLFLDVASGSTADGATIQQWGDGGSANQQWRVTESGGYATIINRASGKALDVWEWSTANGGRISQYTPTGATNQQWELDEVGAGQADIVVAADGSGDYTTVQAAVNAAASGATILIKAGNYKGAVTVPSSKTGLTFIGGTGNAADVVIHENRCAGCDNGSGGTWGTSGSASVLLQGSDFTAEDLTFANSYDEAANGNSQAVAVKVQGDRMVFDNVRFLGNQDTLLTDSPSGSTVSRQYYHDCYVEGDVDFIFGRGTAVFDGCEIKSLTRGSTSNNGYVTAASTEITNPYGLLFYQCDMTSNAPANSVYLGRPWPAGGSTTARGQVLYRQSNLGAHFRTAEPWSDMSGLAWEDARLSEYQNTGPGATINDNRPQMSSSDAANYEPVDYLRGSDGWNPIQ